MHPLPEPESPAGCHSRLRVTRQAPLACVLGYDHTQYALPGGTLNDAPTYHQAADVDGALYVWSSYDALTIDRLRNSGHHEQADFAAGRLAVVTLLDDCKIDVILSGGKHRYWSTWCRHGLHGPCGESRHIKTWASDGTPEELYDTPRTPAQCKTCGAPCICPCHCGCCRGAGEHPCGYECNSCRGSGRSSDTPMCTLPHGADCTCTAEQNQDGAR
jgi:hypothetical protein